MVRITLKQFKIYHYFQTNKNIFQREINSEFKTKIVKRIFNSFVYLIGDSFALNFFQLLPIIKKV